MDSKSFPLCGNFPQHKSIYSRQTTPFYRMIIILLPTFTPSKENVFLLQHLNLKAQKKKNSKPHQKRCQKIPSCELTYPHSRYVWRWCFSGFPKVGYVFVPRRVTRIRPLHCWPGMPGAVESNNSKYLSWDPTADPVLWCPPFNQPSWKRCASQIGSWISQSKKIGKKLCIYIYIYKPTS